jgi:hypothetical protein
MGFNLEDHIGPREIAIELGVPRTSTEEHRSASRGLEVPGADDFLLAYGLILVELAGIDQEILSAFD